MQLFSPRTDQYAKLCLWGVPLLTALFAFGSWLVLWSSYVSGVGVAPEQPILFSHKHHVHDMGIHCLYCHNTVEQSANAGLPATQVCMNCHSYVLPGSPLLANVRRSWESGQAIVWQRVNPLPDHVYFNHSAHVQKGVGCEVCHGRVDLMPLTWKENTFYMRWCVSCHRDPGPRLRPQNEIYTMGWKGNDVSSLAARERGKVLSAEYDVRGHLDDCYTCHR